MSLRRALVCHVHHVARHLDALSTSHVTSESIPAKSLLYVHGAERVSHDRKSSQYIHRYKCGAHVNKATQ